MIVERVCGDIFASAHKHIAFAVNTRGDNNSGFAGVVSGRYWPEIEHTGRVRLGATASHVAGKRTYHALVCHRLGQGGWKETPKVVTECLDALDVPEGETIAVVLMGSGPIGLRDGADVAAIIAGLEASKKKLVVFTR